MKIPIISLALVLTSIISYAQCGTDSIQDYDSNWYHTVPIGNQCWLKENMRTTHYDDGAPILHVIDESDWDVLTETDKAYCWYDNDSITYADSTGALYTWAAAMNGAVSSDSNPSGVQGVCPEGWHIPSDDEWDELENFLSKDGHSGSEGTALKATTGWNLGGNGTDDYGFTALPGGDRKNNGNFGNFGTRGLWWSATEYSATSVWSRYVSYGSSSVVRNYNDKELGGSVRCLRDFDLFDNLTIKLDSIINASTNDNADGAVLISPSGGASPYCYTWSNGDTTQNATGLAPGTYYFTVTDSVYVSISDTFEVKFDPFSIDSLVDSQSICLADSIAFPVPASGGNPPYQYQWYKDGTVLADDTLEFYSIPAAGFSDEGLYYCMVSDEDTTITSDSAELKVIDLTVEACVDNERICSDSTTTLQAIINTNYPDESGTVSYSWSPSAGLSDEEVVNPIASPATTTTYKVTVTDEIGCRASDSVYVFAQNAYIDEQICMVSVDTASGKNMIILEKTENMGTVSYNVYKEVSVNNYQVIATVPFGDLTVVVDTASDPRIQAEKYKISAVDTCGNESTLSGYHQTMHLSINKAGAGAGYNLQWNHYVDEVNGNAFGSGGDGTYYIYRGTTPDNLALHHSLSASNISWTDIDTTQRFYYRIAVKKTDTCDPAGLLKASAGPFSRSISNLEDNRLKGDAIDNSLASKINLQIYPNPFRKQATIEYTIKNTAGIAIAVYNVMGEKLGTIVDESQAPGNYMYQYNPDKPGVYYLQFTIDGNMVVRKIIGL